MNAASDKQAKKAIMKDIILGLHRGLSPEQAKDRFEKEVGSITSTEIATIEQSLIDEGLSPEEIKKFCNVHALIFQAALQQTPSGDTSPSHPVHLFKLENREIEKLLAAIKELAVQGHTSNISDFKEKTNALLVRLKGIETHYERKEQLLFPFLEKQGFMGPSKVMWGKDNEIRDLLKAALVQIEKLGSSGDVGTYVSGTLNTLLEEVGGMIFKEEKILFPTAIEKLPAADWVQILRESQELGYVFIEAPRETELLVKELEEALEEEPAYEENLASFPTGALGLKELMLVLNTLPLDFTFVDRDDTVRYFTAGKSRIFHRPRSAIGRKVQNCHPPQSLDVVEKILTSFREGKRDVAGFWITFRGRFVHIRYFAVRDREGQYLGTLEVTQDVTDIKKLEGERRLLSERD